LVRNSLLLLSIVFAPAVGAFFLPLAGRLSEQLRNYLAFTLVGISLVGSALLLPTVITGQSVTYSLSFPFSFDISFVADSLAIFMAITSSLISTIIIVYSFDYISHYENRNEYYLMVVLFLGAMMGIIFSSNLILLYTFWEITGLASWRLIGFFRKKTDVLRADKAFLVTVFGALVMLLGFISLYHDTGSLNLIAIKQALATTHISNLTTLLLLFGILSKSATLPFHTWLPDAGVAPSPVTALLHAAVLVKIGVYVFARLFLVTMPINEVWQVIVPAVAAASALISAGAALIDTDLKRIIAYSTISQIAFIFFGLAIGSPIAIAGALLYILMHGLAKAGLFMCAGIIEQNAKTKDITQMGGLIKTMPLTAFSFLICAFSVMGVPPLGGFFSKYLVFMGSIQSKEWWIISFFLFGAFLTIIYLFRVFALVFLGEARVQAKEGSRIMVGSVLTLAILSLVAGILIYYPASLANLTVAQMLGGIK